MLHSKEQEILDWLSVRSEQQDLVVYNALNNHRCVPTVEWRDYEEGKTPVVTATSTSGNTYELYVVLHKVTREPVNFFRMSGIWA